MLCGPQTLAVRKVHQYVYLVGNKGIEITSKNILFGFKNRVKY